MPVAERLAARTLELIDIPSESRAEAAVAAHVATVLRDGGTDVRDLGDSCVLAQPAGSTPRVLLAGHLDTVPAQDNLPGRADSNRVHGLGASDMKGACAVMLELVLAGAPYAALFFPREELPSTESALTPLLARVALDYDFVVVMEPTDNELHAGCVGNINASWAFHGRSGHSARPWQAENAITAAALGVATLASAPIQPVSFEGLTFFEVASVTKIAGGIAMNVIPETCTAHVNFRYAPGRTPAAAEARLNELTGGLGELTITGNSGSGAVAVDHPLARRLIETGALRVAPKQAWTPVAEFAAAGFPAVNFGPGATAQAHRRDESIEITALVRAYEVLEAFGSMTVRLSPVLANLGTYPFVRLEQARQQLRASGVAIIDFGMGEPREETPAFIREALAGAITPLAPYPSAVGLPELRGAIADWAARRFGARLDPDTEVIPTLGSKEAVFALANVFAGEVVAVPTPSYPVYDRGALFAGKRVLELPLTEANGWLPDLESVDWTGVGVLWLNYPNNPTGARAPLEFYERAATLAREHGFVLASDEAYSELYFAGEPPLSALQVSDRAHVAVFNTLSKRSSMPGYRSGFVAGDPEIVAALKKYRPNVGVAPLEFVQRAAIAAWSDETHVDEVRQRYRAKREALLPALEAVGLRDAGGDATFFLWMDAGEDADALAARWLEAGVVVAPGSFFGAPNYLRIALVPTPEACARAAEIIRGLA